MGYINVQGVYVYDETDDEAKASDMLNRQSNALTTAIGELQATAPAFKTSVALNVTTASPGAKTTVVFPPGLFTKPPMVMVSRASGGGAKYIPYSDGPTTASVDIGVYSGDGTAGTAAIQVNVVVFR